MSQFIGTVPAAQQMRFAGADGAPRKTTPKKVVLKEGLFKDHIYPRAQRGGWNPSFLVAVRMIILMRFFAAMYSNISDCDEVYNYWEPLHYLLRGKGFQTWEYSPEYSIRSYAYLLANALPSYIAQIFPDKRPGFFALRLTFATVSSICEAVFYRSIANHLSPHIGGYVLVMLLFSAGFYTASTAFLPSTFALWGVLLGSAAAMSPPDGGVKRIMQATLGFAAASILGWPFAAILGVPLVIEQLFLVGTEQTVAAGQSAAWAARRAQNLGKAILAGLILFLAPVVAIDSLAYQKLTVVPWNIISYNLLSPAGSNRGPTLYGTEPASFYFLNGVLNFNILFPMAILAIPLLVLSTWVDPKRFGDLRDLSPNHTHPSTSIMIRLSPFYIWLIVLTLQAHKEERFLYPSYGFIVLNAATSLYLIRTFLEVYYLKVTKSPYRATKTSLFSYLTTVVLILTSFISILRLTALHSYYHAPLNLYHHFQSYELPRLAVSKFPEFYPSSINPKATQHEFRETLDQFEMRFDLTPLERLPPLVEGGGGGINSKGTEKERLRLCLGKEWYRFPSHFLVPDEVQVRFLKTEFDGILPKVWESSREHDEREGKKGGLFGRATGTIPKGMNDLNREEMDRYVDISTCDYLIDLDFPLRHVRSVSKEQEEESIGGEESRYAIQAKKWDRVFCRPFLDTERSSRWTRILKIPGVGNAPVLSTTGAAQKESKAPDAKEEVTLAKWWENGNQWGDYCLLRNKIKHPA